MAAFPLRNDWYVRDLAAAASELAEQTDQLLRLCQQRGESFDLLAAVHDIRSFFEDLAKADQTTPVLED